MTPRQSSSTIGPSPQRNARRPATRRRTSTDDPSSRTARRSPHGHGFATRRLGGRLVRLALVPLLVLLAAPGAAAVPGEAAIESAAAPPPHPGVIEAR
jgi:hypothetical protein